MSQRPNHRRGEPRHQDNGPTYEGGPPNSGCNSTHVAKSRAKWKDRLHRSVRRTGRVGKKFRVGSTRAMTPPDVEES